MRTMSAANKHHREARRTSNRRQFRLAVLTLRRVRRNRHATVWTVERLSFHRRSTRITGALARQPRWWSGVRFASIVLAFPDYHECENCNEKSRHVEVLTRSLRRAALYQNAGRKRDRCAMLTFQNLTCKQSIRSPRLIAIR